MVVDLGLNRSSDHHPCLLAPSSAPSTPPQSTCLLPSPCAASPGPPTALHPASRGPGLAPASSCFSASFLHMPTVHSSGFAHSAHPLPTRTPVSRPPLALCPLSPPPGLVGLSLSYALSLTGLLSGLVSSFTQTEAMLVSVERLEEYSCDLPQEPRGQRPQVAPAWVLAP